MILLFYYEIITPDDNLINSICNDMQFKSFCSRASGVQINTLQATIAAVLCRLQDRSSLTA
jgi:hypothetical protein